MSKAELFLQEEINFILECDIEDDNFIDGLSKEKLEEIKTTIREKILDNMYRYVDERIVDLYYEIKEDMKEEVK
jgi:hypothetical protein